MQIKTTKILVMATMIIMTWLKMSQKSQEAETPKVLFLGSQGCLLSKCGQTG